MADREKKQDSDLRNRKIDSDPQRLIELTSKVAVLANLLDRSRSLAEVTAFLEQAKSNEFLLELFIKTAQRIMADKSRHEPSDLDEGPNKGMVGVRLEDRKLIQTNVRTFKMMLKILVELKGGVKWLADQLEVSVPNISRFFSTDSLPRQSTLAQIYEVLGIEEVQIPVDTDLHR